MAEFGKRSEVTVDTMVRVYYSLSVYRSAIIIYYRGRNLGDIGGMGFEAGWIQNTIALDTHPLSW